MPDESERNKLNTPQDWYVDPTDRGVPGAVEMGPRRLPSEETRARRMIAVEALSEVYVNLYDLRFGVR